MSSLTAHDANAVHVLLTAAKPRFEPRKMAISNQRSEKEMASFPRMVLLAPSLHLSKALTYCLAVINLRSHHLQDRANSLEPTYESSRRSHVAPSEIVHSSCPLMAQLISPCLRSLSLAMLTLAFWWMDQPHQHQQPTTSSHQRGHLATDGPCILSGGQ